MICLTETRGWSGESRSAARLSGHTAVFPWVAPSGRVLAVRVAPLGSGDGDVFWALVRCVEAPEGQLTPEVELGASGALIAR